MILHYMMMLTKIFGLRKTIKMQERVYTTADLMKALIRLMLCDYTLIKPVLVMRQHLLDEIMRGTI